jgi:hypothetical protein
MNGNNKESKMTHIRIRTIVQAGASKMQCVELMDGERIVRELIPPTYNPVWGMARSWADTLGVAIMDSE